MKPINEELPSERILFALAALRDAEGKDSEIKVDMNVFHLPIVRHSAFSDSHKKCYACLGGIAAIGRGLVNISDEFNSQESAILTAYGKPVSDYERSLDFARTGDVGQMFRCMEFPQNEGQRFERSMPDYNDKPAAFKNALKELAIKLQEHGY